MKTITFENEINNFKLDLKKRILGIALKVSKPQSRPHFYHAEAVQAQERFEKHKTDYQLFRYRVMF